MGIFPLFWQGSLRDMVGRVKAPLEFDACRIRRFLPGIHAALRQNRPKKRMEFSAKATMVGMRRSHGNEVLDDPAPPAATVLQRETDHHLRQPSAAHVC
jgi:hypothetical protein